MPGTRKLGRTTAHRTAMLRAMVTFLFDNGKIETTVTRAKEVSSMAEKMITIAKTNDLHSKRLVMAFVTNETVTKKLFDEIAPKYADVMGGYTRITKIGPRRGDAAEMAVIRLAGYELPTKDDKKKKKDKSDKADKADKSDKKDKKDKKEAKAD